MEKALTYLAPSEQDVLLRQLGDASTILALACTQFGCYVARALVQDIRVDGKEALKLIAQNRPLGKGVVLLEAQCLGANCRPRPMANGSWWMWGLSSRAQWER